VNFGEVAMWLVGCVVWFGGVVGCGVRVWIDIGVFGGSMMMM